jgi:type IV pilus assembly protein PilC
MPAFNFRALTSQGLTQEGTVDAVSREAALQRLMEDGLTPLVVVPQEEPKDVMKMLARVRPIKHEILVQFSRQLATMIDAGIGIARSLEVLESQADNPKFKGILLQILNEVNAGGTLSGAMEKHPLVFDFTYVAMVRSGEKSGSLDEALLKLAMAMERELKLRRAIRSATMYPKIVAIFASMIIAVLILWMVPKFANLYILTAKDIGHTPGQPPIDTSLPGPTQLVVDFSKLVFPPPPHGLLWFGSFGLRLLAIAVLIYAIKRGLRFAKTKPKFRRQWDYMKLNLPRVGGLIQKIAVARFARTFASMMAAGIAPVEAMPTVGDVAGNFLIKEATMEAREHMLAGASIAGPLTRSKVFPLMLTQMIEVGEESGQLQLMLEKAAEFYEGEVEEQIKGLTSLIEPLMVIIVGMAIGFIVIVTYLPMFHLYDLIQA